MIVLGRQVDGNRQRLCSGLVETDSSSPTLRFKLLSFRNSTVPENQAFSKQLLDCKVILYRSFSSEEWLWPRPVNSTKQQQNTMHMTKYKIICQKAFARVKGDPEFVMVSAAAAGRDNPLVPQSCSQIRGRIIWSRRDIYPRGLLKWYIVLLFNYKSDGRL